MDVSSVFQLIAGGALAGLLAGFMGIGGGVVLTPLCLILYPKLGISGSDLIKVIFATDMIPVTAFSISSAFSHNAKKRVAWKPVLLMIPGAVVGSYAGGYAASVIASGDLKKAFAVFLFFISLTIIKNSIKKEDTSGSSFVLPLYFIPFLGITAGFLGSFLGLGGGVILVPFMILLFAVPVEKAAGTSSMVIIFVGIAGIISYAINSIHVNMMIPGWSSGYVWWSAAIPIVIGGVPAANLGAWLNSKTHYRMLQVIFGVILMIISIRIFLMG